MGNVLALRARLPVHCNNLSRLGVNDTRRGDIISIRCAAMAGAGYLLAPRGCSKRDFVIPCANGHSQCR